MTKSQQVAKELCALLRARASLLWIVTREESRVERYLFEAAASANYLCRFWDIAQGVTALDGTRQSIGANDPGEMLTAIQNRATNGNQRELWVMRDLAPWLQGLPGASPTRQIKNIARMRDYMLKESAQALVIISASSDVPQELQNCATVIQWPLPDREEIALILDSTISSLGEEYSKSAAPNGTRDASIDAAIGLSEDETLLCFKKSLVTNNRKIDSVAVAAEKKRVINKSGMLEYYEPLEGGFAAVGGLENIKIWTRARKSAYSPSARAYGLPSPKGIFLVGISGCGKTYSAKAIATELESPLIKLNFGTQKSKFVGESEKNTRESLQTIEAVGRCVVWVDEIEKDLQGATSGSADGGVSADALGQFLTWMQERKGESFVVATANDVSALPPELLRKGRFDEVFFVDLPNVSEREAVLAATLRIYKRDKIGIDLAKVAAACVDFTGSEIAAIVPDALFAAFADNVREITTQDLLIAAATVTPLSKTAKEKIDALRMWSKGRARPASASDSEVGLPKGTPNLRVIDLG